MYNNNNINGFSTYNVPPGVSHSGDGVWFVARGDECVAK